MKNSIFLINNNQGLQTLKIKNKSFDSTTDFIFDLPQKLIGKININDFPATTTLRPYQRKVLGNYSYKHMPIIIKSIGNGMVSLEIEACRDKIDSLYIIGLDTFQLLKMEFIDTQKTFNPVINIFEIDESMVHLHYTIEVPSDIIDNLIATGVKFDEDIDTKILNSMEKYENDIRKELGIPLL